MKPLCFVLMPVGVKSLGDGQPVDFDLLYSDVIQPAVERAGLEPLRATDKLPFERLVLCDFAVADLTTANPDVLYAFGMRHATRPWSTVALFATGTRLPFDVNSLRATSYSIGVDGRPEHPCASIEALVAMLQEAKRSHLDSPVFTLLEGFSAPDIKRLKTDVFRGRAEYSARAKAELAALRDQGVEALRGFENAEREDLREVECGIVIDLLLSYRSVQSWEDMVRVAESMSKPLRRTVMVREQRALALNRLGRSEEAERELLDLLSERGPSSETYGLLGRVYKDRWEIATRQGVPEALQAALIRKAIAAYRNGFEADWRDAYPGVNAVTLMEFETPKSKEQRALLPIVEYAASRRVAAGTPDYWDYATLLQIAVLRGDPVDAGSHLADALLYQREGWEGETTARNIRLVREARQGRGESAEWIEAIEEKLLEGS